MQVQKISFKAISFGHHVDHEYRMEPGYKKTKKVNTNGNYDILDNYKGNFDNWLNTTTNQRKYSPQIININSDKKHYYLTLKGRISLKNIEVLNLARTEEGRMFLEEFKNTIITPEDKRSFTLVRRAAADELSKFAKKIK